jgi:hypothetical protein
MPAGRKLVLHYVAGAEQKGLTTKTSRTAKVAGVNVCGVHAFAVFEVFVAPKQVTIDAAMYNQFIDK